MTKQNARRRLEERREELERIRSALEVAPMDESELSTEDQHPADLGTETFEREKTVSILHRLDTELSDVRWALRRIEGGRYGLCEACGKPIAKARLEAVPAARFCIRDQALAEREARAAS